MYCSSRDAPFHFSYILICSPIFFLMLYSNSTCVIVRPDHNVLWIATVNINIKEEYLFAFVENLHIQNTAVIQDRLALDLPKWKDGWIIFLVSFKYNTLAVRLSSLLTWHYVQLNTERNRTLNWRVFCPFIYLGLLGGLLSKSIQQGSLARNDGVSFQLLDLITEFNSLRTISEEDNQEKNSDLKLGVKTNGILESV